MNYQSVAQTLGLKQPIPTSFDLVEMAHRGIPKKSIYALAESLQVTIAELTKYLHVSERTLQRYAPEKRLSSTLSDRILQIAKVYARSSEVFEDAEDAARWLKQPNIALGNTEPLELLDTAAGIEMVLDELTRMEYGVFA